MTSITPEILERDKNFPFNFAVNMMDGGFFGLGVGFASFVTILPLFVSTLTNSALLIGLIPAIHAVGWQLPQVFTAQHVSRQRRYKPMVLFLTVQERLPFLGLALVAWFATSLGLRLALMLTFMLLIWQGLGGGFTANAWQSMIGKIIPGDRWGFFFGFQAAIANLFASGSAVIAGFMLERLSSPLDFTLCFMLTVVAMIFSWFSLAMTREGDTPPVENTVSRGDFWKGLGVILRRDVNFRWFLVVKILAQIGTMGFAFYTVYAVRSYGMGEGTVGVLTGVLTIVQTAANPLMGWLGDRWSHRGVMGFGLFAAAVSAVLAWQAQSVSWFFLVFTLAGFANVAVWTIGMAMTLEFGSEAERPAYIGLSNTLIAPTGFLVPLFGGWLADRAGYQATFVASAIGAIATVLVLIFILREQKKR
jgi:MFS family permease